MENGETQPKSRKLPRRDFLKVIAGLAMALTVAGHELRIGARKKTEEEEDSFETPDAIYLPFLEEHLHRDSTPRILTSRPDYLFLELTTPALDATTETPLGFLSMDTAALVNGKRVPAGKLVDNVMIDGLNGTGCTIIIEGVGVPDVLVLLGEMVNYSVRFASVASLIDAVRAIRNKRSSDYENSRARDTAKLAISLLTTVWANSDALFREGLASFARDINEPHVREAREIAANFNAVESLAHPERIQIFLRNIFMALKLILVAEKNPREIAGKPKIAYRVGDLHGAVGNMVRGGRGVCLKLLNIYPDVVLTRVVDFNDSYVPRGGGGPTMSEKIRLICTTPAFPIEVAIHNGKRQLLFDEELYNYLNARLVG